MVVEGRINNVTASSEPGPLKLGLRRLRDVTDAEFPFMHVVTPVVTPDRYILAASDALKVASRRSGDPVDRRQGLPAQIFSGFFSRFLK